MPTLAQYIADRRTKIELDALAEMQETLREIGKRTLAEIDNQPDDHSHAVAYDPYRHWELIDTTTD